MNQIYEQFATKMRQVADIHHAMAVLNWDQETYMPTKGASHKSSQIATLAGVAHDMETSSELGSLLQELQANLSSLEARQQRNVVESAKAFSKRQKYNKAFVERSAKLTSQCFQAWAKAKQADDFSIFEPVLTKMVALKREEAELLGYEAHPYDALMDNYEPGERVANIDLLFADVKAQLVDFVKEISEKPQVADKWMFAHYNKDKQWQYGLDILKQMGYDFEAGRQDIAAHPFTTSFGPQDVRVTTRINENDFHEMLWSCIHEGGHALYEQGLKSEDYGLPTGAYISLGIHESQSRLWENNVGRSHDYWAANYPKLQKNFPENLANIGLDAFYKSMNKVQPSLIRTNADELTYHFHIMIRYEIEKALIEGSMEVKDLPTVWNQKYKDYLGIDVPSDAKGCLQDIHWSHGSFGYFATYSLGSFYAAQFFHQAAQDIPELAQHIRSGNMMTLLDWLRTKVHQHGRFYSAEELCVHITGEKLNFRYFMDYAKAKYGAIYG